MGMPLVWVGAESLVTPVITRVWAMPSPNTFSIPPIARLLDRWLTDCSVIVDPFARTAVYGTVTNDLDPAQPTQYHLEATEFCRVLCQQGLQVDAILFDPPYSSRQVSECYKGVGRHVGMQDTQTGRLYKTVRDGLDALARPGTVAISCGWNSAGFGVKRGYVLHEILLVAHGGAHNDTIVTVEVKS